MFVSLLMLLTPQQWEVLVNVCSFTRTSTGFSPALSAAGITPDELGHVTRIGCLFALLVDPTLAFDGNSLVGRQGVDGEKSFRMPAETIRRHHPNPSVNGSRTPMQRLSESADLPESLRMVENQKVFRERCSAIPVDLRQSVINLLETGWIQARAEQDRALRVDIATGRPPAKKHRLQQSGPRP